MQKNQKNNKMLKSKKIIYFFFLFVPLYADESLSLFDAIVRGEVALANYMIKKRADVNVTNEDGMTPLHFVWDFSLAKTLIINGANVNAKNNQGSSPLHWAVSRNLVNIARLLIEYGADVNMTDINGQTPLHFAARNGNDVLILLLIKNGADVNATDKSGSTPLLTALSFGYQKSSRFLTMAGASEISNTDALAPSSFASLTRNPEVVQILETKQLEPLIRAIFIENFAEAEKLIRSGADVNISDINGNTALHWAFTKKNRYLSKLLLDKGADISSFNHNGQTPLDVLKALKEPSFEKYIHTLISNKTKPIRVGVVEAEEEYEE